MVLLHAECLAKPVSVDIRYIYGKELWEVYMDQEGVPQDDTARLFCRDFFKTETFLSRIESLFDQFDTDNSGVLKRCAPAFVQYHQTIVIQYSTLAM